MAESFPTSYSAKSPPTKAIHSLCGFLPHVGFPSGSLVKNLPTMQETQETWLDPCWEVPLEKEMAARSSTYIRELM